MTHDPPRLRDDTAQAPDALRAALAAAHDDDAPPPGQLAELAQRLGAVGFDELVARRRRRGRRFAGAASVAILAAAAVALWLTRTPSSPPRIAPVAATTTPSPERAAPVDASPAPAERGAGSAAPQAPPGEIRIVTLPEKGTVFVDGVPRGSSGVLIRGPLHERRAITCRLAGHRDGEVAAVFAPSRQTVTCRMARAKRCVQGLKNPFDDCADPAAVDKKRSDAAPKKPGKLAPLPAPGGSP